jgi:NAD(P)-dependent dehydrogenase (short-subunit alcohol dehydrogenase family)
VKFLIAGASGGIGKYLADALSKDYQVFGTYHSRKPKDNPSYQLDMIDINDEALVSSWIENTCKIGDNIVFVYCIGINYNVMMHKSDINEWSKVIGANLMGVPSCLRSMLPIMRQTGFGRIILLSSVVPQIGVSGTSAYSASKAALWGLSKSVARENAKHGITINTINLGYFDIGMIKDVPEKAMSQIITSIPVGHLGNPQNILKTVEFIVSADYLTGTTIDLNGGLY